jgi:hypothetical protein
MAGKAFKQRAASSIDGGEEAIKGIQLKSNGYELSRAEGEWKGRRRSNKEKQNRSYIGRAI